jgi:23S rRNA pseudouridine2605 synthase
VSENTSEGERLQKVLARAGFGSRRACDELVGAGRVTVNGERAALGRRIDVSCDVVCVDGNPVGVLPELVYYVCNKPMGVVTTAHDPEGRPSIIDLVPNNPRVFPVGRLDFASEGLIVLTNDGGLAQLLSHPSHGVEKEYLVELHSDPTPSMIKRLRAGVEIEQGITTAPAKVARVSPKLMRITIHEGRYRQVRRMCAVVGLEVSRLVRTRIGPLIDSRLAPGEFRELRIDEVRALALAAAASSPAPARPH